MKTVSYTKTRLHFDANLIESLDWHDKFRIVTPHGTFELSKREFYETFSNVVKTSSYRRGKCYHYKKTPKKAEQFLVR